MFTDYPDVNFDNPVIKYTSTGPDYHDTVTLLIDGNIRADFTVTETGLKFRPVISNITRHDSRLPELALIAARWHRRNKSKFISDHFQIIHVN